MDEGFETRDAGYEMRDKIPLEANEPVVFYRVSHIPHLVSRIPLQPGSARWKALKLRYTDFLER